MSSNYDSSPVFKPIKYNYSQCILKHKGLLVRNHVRKARDRLRHKRPEWSAAKRNAVAKMIAYYPYHSEQLHFKPLNMCTVPMPEIDVDSSPNSGYLLKDLPEKIKSKTVDSDVTIRGIDYWTPSDNSTQEYPIFSSPNQSPMPQVREQAIEVVGSLSPVFSKITSCLPTLQAKENVPSPILSKDGKRYKRQNTHLKRLLPSLPELSNSQLSTKPPSICLLLPDNHSIEFQQLRAFNRLPGCTYTNQYWRSSTTHVLTVDVEYDDESGRPFIRQPTYWHFLAAGQRKFLVSKRWLEDSISHGQPLDPVPYEPYLDLRADAPATKMARMNEPASLFRGCAFVLARPFVCFGGNLESQRKLEKLLVCYGAKVAENPKELRLFTECPVRYCIMGEKGYFDKENNKMRLLKHIRDIPVVPYERILECFAHHKNLLKN